MSLQSEIRHKAAGANAFHRLVQRFAQSRLGAAVLPRFLRVLDLLVNRLTRGRTTLTDVFAGLPIVMLTTTGARSGLARTNPVMGIPLGDDLAVLGGNIGTGVIPSWVYNLRAHPDATLTYRNNSVEITAVEVTGSEAENVFKASYMIFPGYAVFRKRFTEPIPAFVLHALP